MNVNGTHEDEGKSRGLPAATRGTGDGSPTPDAVGQDHLGPPTWSVVARLDEKFGPTEHLQLSADGDDRSEFGTAKEIDPRRKQVGHYEMHGQIAQGGMGVVLKGRDTDLGRDVALKFLRSEHRDSPTMVRRFVDEAQIGGQLQHPGILPVPITTPRCFRCGCRSSTPRTPIPGESAFGN